MLVPRNRVSIIRLKDELTVTDTRAPGLGHPHTRTGTPGLRNPHTQTGTPAHPDGNTWTRTPSHPNQDTRTGAHAHPDRTPRRTLVLFLAGSRYAAVEMLCQTNLKLTTAMRLTLQESESNGGDVQGRGCESKGGKVNSTMCKRFRLTTSHTFKYLEKCKRKGADIIAVCQFARRCSQGVEI